MKQQNSVLAHMKTTILSQSKEISELKLKLENQVRVSNPYGYWPRSALQTSKVDQNAYNIVQER